MEVTVTGPNRDLHSGLYGGTVANPINILCDMIASLHDENKKVNIPGFYDHVEEISEPHRKMMNANGTDDKSFKSSIGIKAVMGEKGFTTLDRRSIRPTLMSMEFGVVIQEKVQKQLSPVKPTQNFYAPCAKSKLGKHK